MANKLAVWGKDKKPVAEMDYTHLCNALRYMEGKAKEQAELAGMEEVELASDTKYSEEWTENLPDIYYDVFAEKESREKQNRIHEDLPNF